ncbi:hypothetical protein GCM10018980_03040 [Streptomyces capoamus]|uniref:Secreted protein n=1 Tax=Streptomyces capoamus TaxID=68183 RepID=A0A919EUV3_9ACTN|nr:hypothetical protein [Streptomyces capoamus]GGW12114.1 hypothetical protein GCM10010501_11050 [Streptomyces libani subsp. rufus]GHG33919.1 hypothetical protein GCM10018980_03040 [Streptomyces capoamus]
MRRVRSASLALVGAAACIALSAPPSQAAAGDTASMCGSQLTPSGWVDIQWWNSWSCGTTFSPNMKKIEQLTGFPVGTTVNVCASTYPPAGWVQVNSYYSGGCQYSAVPSSQPNSWTIKRVS